MIEAKKRENRKKSGERELGNNVEEPARRKRESGEEVREG